MAMWPWASHFPSPDLNFSSVQSLSRVRLFVTPWTAAYQAPPSMGFSRQEYWSGVPLPSPHTPRQHIKDSILKRDITLLTKVHLVSSVQFSCSIVSDCDPMNCSTPDLPVHHQLPESTQIHVHCVGDAIQPSPPLSSPSPPALNLFQHQDLFKWVSSPHQVAKVLEFQLQH